MKHICARLRQFFPETAGPECKQYALEIPGLEISTFFRSYYYRTGDFSAPHYDRSFVELDNESSSSVTDGDGVDGNSFVGTKELPEQHCPTPMLSSSPKKICRLSAYSILFYLGSGCDRTGNYCQGGETTFFKDDKTVTMSCSGLTPTVDVDPTKLSILKQIVPHAGDVLIFPHGNHQGCHSNPLHEGSLVRSGEKILLRSDIMFRRNLNYTNPSPIKKGSPWLCMKTLEQNKKLESSLVILIKSIHLQLIEITKKVTVKLYSRMEAVDKMCDACIKMVRVTPNTRSSDGAAEKIVNPKQEDDFNRNLLITFHCTLAQSIYYRARGNSKQRGKKNGGGSCAVAHASRLDDEISDLNVMIKNGFADEHLDSLVIPVSLGIASCSVPASATTTVCYENDKLCIRVQIDKQSQ